MTVLTADSMANASIAMLWETLVNSVCQLSDACLLHSIMRVMFRSATNVQPAASPVLLISDAAPALVAIYSTPVLFVLTLVHQGC